MSEAKNLDWKTYESITRYIYETLGKQNGVTVEGYGSSCRVIGKSGVSHQIDVLTKHSDGIHTYKTAIECKYWNRKVDKEIVMKLSEIIEDAGINKGVIVSKNGFTQDGIDYAKYRNIGLVELREVAEKDLKSGSKEMDIGFITINMKIIIKRPQILKIDIGNDRAIEIAHEFDYSNFIIIEKNERHIPLINYVNDFRKEINQRNKMNKKIIKRYEILEADLFNRQTKETMKIDAITFTGQLIEIDESKKVEFKLVDEVWLIMKSIFDERTFTFSETGLIIEHKI